MCGNRHSAQRTCSDMLTFVATSPSKVVFDDGFVLNDRKPVFRNKNLTKIKLCVQTVVHAHCKVVKVQQSN